MTFTPRHAGTNLRLSMHLTDADEIQRQGWGRSEGYRGIVTDRETGQRWHVFGAHCELPNCKCDAVVYEVRD